MGKRIIFIYKKLTLKDREWTCGSCNSILDRDINAAVNIKSFALKNKLSGEHTLKNQGKLPTLVGALTLEAQSIGSAVGGWFTILLLTTVFSFSQTTEEMSASEYALASFRQLGIVEQENYLIKAELLQLKTTKEILISNFNKMDDLVEYWQEKYNVSEKQAKKEVRKQKRKAWFRGVILGIGTGVVIFTAVASSSGK